MKKIISIILILILSYLLPAVNIKKAEKYYKKAEKYYLKKNYSKAEKFLKESLKEDPNYPQSLFLRGNIYYRQKNYSLAYKDLKKANEMLTNQNSVHAVYLQFIKNYSSYLVEKENYLKAKEIAKEMLKNKNYINLLIKEGNNFMKGSKFITLSLYSLGILLENKGQLPLSFEIYSMLIRNKYLWDNDSKAKDFYLNSLYRSGLLKIKFKDIGKGEEFLTKFLKENKKERNKEQLIRAMIILADNKLIEIRNELNKLNSQNDENIKTKIKELSKQNKFIEEYYQKILSLNPKMEIVYQNLATYYYWSEEYKKSAQIYEELIKKFPNSKNKESYIKSKKIVMNEENEL